MASVQEIIAINSRQGNSEKGGSQTYGITIDASPFQRLAEYTYLDNVQKQKDKVAKDQQIATEMGKVMALDPNSTNKELYEALNKQAEEINYLIKNNKDIFDYNKNPAGNVKMKELVGKFAANREKATAFDVLNNSAETAISALPPEQQVSARQVLENKRKIALVGGADNFFKTGTQLETGIMDFKKEDYTVPKLSKLSYITVDIGGDNNFENKISIVDINGARAKAAEKWLGLTDSFVPEENPNNDEKIALRNKNGLIYSKAKNKNKYSDETLAKMNSLISEYRQKKAALDASPVGPEPTKTAQMIAIDAVNQNITATNSALDEIRRNSPNLQVPKYDLINYDDEITGEELILAETLTGQGAETFLSRERTAKFTGNETAAANNKMDNAVQWYNAKTSRITATRPTTTNPQTGEIETQSAYDSIVGTIASTVNGKDGAPLEMPVANLTEYQAQAINPKWVEKKENGVLSFSSEFETAKKNGVKIFKAKDGADGTPGSLGYTEGNETDGKRQIIRTPQQVDDGGVGVTFQLPNTKQDGTGIFGQKRKIGVTPKSTTKKYMGLDANNNPIYK